MRTARCLLVFLALLLLPGVVSTQTVVRYKKIVVHSALTTQLNGLTNNATSTASSLIDNRVASEGGAGPGLGALLCEFQLDATFGTIATPANPTAGSAPILWILRCLDDTNCETTPTASVSLGRTPNVQFPVTTGQSQTLVSQETRCPPGQWKVALKNDGTGQQMKESGNTVKISFVTFVSQ